MCMYFFFVVAPRPTASPTNQIVKAGDVIRISCMADGSQPMDYEWSKVCSMGQVGNCLPQSVNVKEI